MIRNEIGDVMIDQTNIFVFLINRCDHDNLEMSVKDASIKSYDSQCCLLCENYLEFTTCYDLFIYFSIDWCKLSFCFLGGRYVKVWDLLKGGQPLVSLKNHHKTVTSLCLGSNGQRLLSASLDRYEQSFIPFDLILF